MSFFEKFQFVHTSEFYADYSDVVHFLCDLGMAPENDLKVDKNLLFQL